jgi:dipeptidyl aminopeptidase/acylaminoacyl peptidase
MKKSPVPAPPSAAVLSDFRDTALYKEAETLFAQSLRPGCGRPAGALELTVSPDGRSVAFTGALLDKLEGTPTTHICSASLATGELRVWSFGPHTDLTPKFAPDGKSLTFRSDRANPGNFQLYSIDFATGATRALPVAPGWVEYFDYSPDGKRILAGIAGHGADVSGAQGAKTSKRADAGQAPAWMPTVESGDETFRRRSAWILDLAADAWTTVVPDKLNVWEACWCGNRAIAAVVSAGADEGDWYRAHLVACDARTRRVRTLYEPQDQLSCLSGSPDGKQLAFVEAACSDRWVVAGDLRIVNLGTGEVRKPVTAGVDVTFTTWRNERRVLVAGVREFETVVADVDAANGRFHERWASVGLYCQNFFYPVAAPVPGSNDQCLVNATGFLRPTRILRVGSGTPRQIVDFGHDGTAAIARKLRPVEPYRWRAPDGTEIQGWLMRGPDRKPAPLVMEVHGGPIWRWPPMFLGRSAWHVMLAERGYALFWPNPRGSTGRGQDFARKVIGDMGGDDTRDYLSGLDQLVADGIADPQRIGLTGGSYGGYMSSWLITQDQRFAAAVPVAPVTNWVSQHLTSNIAAWDAWFLGGNYSDPDGHFRERSPIMFANRVKTPTLNICGALDRCTPPGQAQEFHNALRLHGAESVLVTYPQEGHGVRTFPAMIDHAARVVDWFERYMPGSKGR